MTALTIPDGLNGAHLPAPADNLAAYINAVRAIPLLSRDEESRLAQRLREDGDTAAARQLVLSNLRLVVSIARGYGGYGLDQTDLIQEGNIGLLKAVRKFDPAHGVRLATFAVYWVRAEVHEFILRNWRIVKIATTKAQRKLFFSMRKLNQKRPDGAVPSDAEIAAELNVEPQEVKEMRSRIYNTDAVLMSTEGDDKDVVTADTYLAADEADNPEEQLEKRCQHQALADAMQQISEREREILYDRRLSDPPKTLQTLSDKHGISVERVRQIEQAAMNKISALVKSQLSLPVA